MNPGRFFIPNYSYMMPVKNVGIFSRIFGGFRGINWTSLLANANKTLNVVNQTIPLIRQTGPMFNNLRSMIQLTKAFNSQTISSNRNNGSSSNNKKIATQTNIVDSSVKSDDVSYQVGQPNFFI